MDFDSYFKKVDEAADWLKARLHVRPEAVVILSAGLGGLLESIDSELSVLSREIPHFPAARAEGHEGRLIFGTMGGFPLVSLSGRFHYYEGHPPHEVVFPLFVLAKLGAKFLIATNAAGGIKKGFGSGDIMMLTDHINLMGMNPLVGVAVCRQGGQFTDMTEAYSRRLMKVARSAAGKAKVKLKEGVYLAVSGPSYETKAEIRAMRGMGADAVGMSTVPEVIAARFLGMETLALSCIANPAADLHKGKMSHEEVLHSMVALAPKATALIKNVIAELARL